MDNGDVTLTISKWRRNSRCILKTKNDTKIQIFPMNAAQKWVIELNKIKYFWSDFFQDDHHNGKLSAKSSILRYLIAKSLFTLHMNESGFADLSDSTKILYSVRIQNGGNTSMESKISYFHFQNNNCLKTEKILDKNNSHRWNCGTLK